MENSRFPPCAQKSWTHVRRAALARHQAGTDDESLWCGTHEVERIAGDQRQLGLLRRFQHTDVFWRNHLDRLHAIPVRTAPGGKLDRIAFANLAQRAEKSIAMRSQYGVTGLAWHRRTRNVAYCPHQRMMIVTLGDHRRNANLRNGNPSEHRMLDRRRCAFRNTLRDRKSTRLNSSHMSISYAVFCL